MLGSICIVVLHLTLSGKTVLVAHNHITALSSLSNGHMRVSLSYAPSVEIDESAEDLVNMVKECYDPQVLR